MYESLYFSASLEADCISIFASRNRSRRYVPAMRLCTAEFCKLRVDFNVLAIMSEAFDFSWLLCGVNIRIFLPNYMESYLTKQHTLQSLILKVLNRPTVLARPTGPVTLFFVYLLSLGLVGSFDRCREKPLTVILRSSRFVLRGFVHSQGVPKNKTVLLGPLSG